MLAVTPPAMELINLNVVRENKMKDTSSAYKPVFDRIDALEAEVNALISDLELSEATNKMWVKMAKIQVGVSFESARRSINPPTVEEEE